LPEDRDITAYIPIHPKPETGQVGRGDFTDRRGHLIGPIEIT